MIDLPKIGFNLFPPQKSPEKRDFAIEDPKTKPIFPDHKEVVPGTFASTGGNIKFGEILAKDEYFFKPDSKEMSTQTREILANLDVFLKTLKS